MQKMMKRVLPVTLSLALCLCLLPGLALGADGDFLIEDGVLKRYFGKDSHVTIPNGVTTIGRDSFSNNSTMTSVTIPDSVTTIVGGAFAISGLTSIIIPDSVTTIGSSAFYKCEYLTSVTLGSGLTTIEASLFDRCFTLKSIIIPDTISAIGANAFNNCNELTSVKIGNGVKSIGVEAFDFCTSLTELEIGNSVETIDLRAFRKCESLQSVTIPDSVKTIKGWAFQLCTSLTNLELGSGVTSVGTNAFKDCAALKTLAIPANVEVLEDFAFSGSNLESVTIHNSNMKIGAYSILNPSLKTVYGHPGSSAETFTQRQSLTFVPLAPSAAPNVDTATGWAQEAINQAYTIGLIPAGLQSAYTGTTTRAEFCALGVALFEKVQKREITTRETFSDTTDVNVEKMASLGVVSGIGDNLFDPDANLTREQAATMLARLAQVMGKSLPKQETTFADKASISSWAVTPVGQMQASGVMSGVGDNTFAPQGQYTREQSIATILRLYEAVK